MSEDLEDFGLVQRQREIQTKLGKLGSYRTWYQETFARYPEKTDESALLPFSIKTASAKQEQAIRSLAKEYGFDDLRGFNKFMEGAHVNYYDLIKVASP